MEDPEDHFKIAIATWPLDAILAGIAVFEGKRGAGTLPEGADARYLRGQVKNITLESEGWAIAEALLRARLDAHDQALEHLTQRQHSLEQVGRGIDELVKQYTERLLRGQLRDAGDRQPGLQRSEMVVCPP